jgi:hypothetical protein
MYVRASNGNAVCAGMEVERAYRSYACNCRRWLMWLQGAGQKTILNYWYCTGLLGSWWFEIANKLGQILLITGLSIPSMSDKEFYLPIGCSMTWNRLWDAPTILGALGDHPARPTPGPVLLGAFDFWTKDGEHSPLKFTGVSPLRPLSFGTESQQEGWCTSSSFTGRWGVKTRAATILFRSKTLLNELSDYIRF